MPSKSQGAASKAAEQNPKLKSDWEYFCSLKLRMRMLSWSALRTNKFLNIRNSLKLISFASALV